MVNSRSAGTRFPDKPSLVVLGLAVLLGACAPRVDVRGNLPDPDLLADIEVGHVSRQEVEEILGSPSSKALFKGESWYYISERTETVAFFAPEVKERKVVILRFDKKGVVKEKLVFGLERGRVVELVERKTPTAGREFSFLKQMFGNLGRFEGGGE